MGDKEDVPTSPVDEAIRELPRSEKEKENETPFSEFNMPSRIPFSGTLASGAKSLLSTVSFWSSRSADAHSPVSPQLVLPGSAQNDAKKSMDPSNSENKISDDKERLTPTTVQSFQATDPLLPPKLFSSRPVSMSSQPTMPQGHMHESNPVMRPEDLPREEMDFVKSRTKNKSPRDFDKLFVSQVLMLNGFDTTSLGSAPSTSAPNKPGAVWAIRFSRDGEYLAAGGQDGLIRVWGLRLLAEDESFSTFSSEHREAGFVENLPVFTSRPIRTYSGHQSDVLDLSWSKSGFLLSSSTDKTVRLWHVGRSECLCCYQHVDFVTSVAFHPKNDRFFLSGSLDCRIRLWNIPEKKVASWAELPDSNLVTAVGFSPDGSLAIAGSYHGLCLFYKTEGLELQTQITVKSGSKTRNVAARKITGIETFSDASFPDGKVMITSNDSRIRIYNLKDFSLDQKFKGPENNSNQIKASYSDDLRFVVCGSENRQIYLFDLITPIKPDALNHKRHFLTFKKKGDEPGCETVETHSHIVTGTCLAPLKTKRALAKLGDPLINPDGLALDSLDKSLKDGHILVSSDYFGNLKVLRRSSSGKSTMSVRSLNLEDSQPNLSSHLSQNYTQSINENQGSVLSIQSSIRSSPVPININPNNALTLGSTGANSMPTESCKDCGSSKLACYVARLVLDNTRATNLTSEKHSERIAERPSGLAPSTAKQNGSHASLLRRNTNDAELNSDPMPCDTTLTICLNCSKVLSGLDR